MEEVCNEIILAIILSCPQAHGTSHKGFQNVMSMSLHWVPKAPSITIFTWEDSTLCVIVRNLWVCALA